MSGADPHLTREQRNMVIEWIASGDGTTAVRQKSTQCDPPFTVSKELINYYKKSRKLRPEDVVKNGEMESIKRGLALREVRIEKLIALGEQMEKDLEKGLWVKTTKAVNNGKDTFETEYFNNQEIEQFRGVMDDIAREVGDRKQSTEIKNKFVISLDDINKSLKKVYGDGTDE